MDYNKLANTDLHIPRMSLGTMTFGGQTDEAASKEILAYAYEQGLTLWDTANIYTEGRSEEIVGESLKKYRDEIILATKVGYPSGNKLSGVCLSREAILSEFDKSRQRLQTDYVDLYYMHAPDYNTPFEETLETMSQLVEEGKVGYIGVSNHAAWQIAEIMAICDREGYHKPVMTQNVYNAITRSIEPELIPYIEKHPIGLTVYNPIAAGLLTGKHTDLPAEGSRLADNPIYKNRYWSDANLRSVGKLNDIAKEAGLSILELAFKWCYANDKVTSIISGVSKLDQLRQNIAACDGQGLEEEVIMACQKVWEDHTGNPFKYNR